jgi:hypothetical protein
MNSKSQFTALEMMSRAKAAAARKEMEYWLAEAAEWKKLKESLEPFAGIVPTQLDWCTESNNH